jgi:hypothetical protein
LVAIINVHRQHSTTTRAAPSTSATRKSLPLIAIGAKGPLVPTGPGTPVGLAVGNAFYALMDNPARLIAFDASGLEQQTPVLARPQFLVPDTATGRIWVVGRGAAGRARLGSYDAVTLTASRPVDLPYRVSMGVMLDGTLYLGGAAGILAVRSPARITPLATTPGQTPGVQAMIADPIRHRLIAASTDFPSRLRILRTGSTLLVDGPKLPLGHVSLAEVVAQLWAAGTGTGAGASGVLRLNPITLQPEPDAAIGHRFGPVAGLGSGVVTVWVREAGNGLVSCIDAVTGNVITEWPDVTGTVVSQESSERAEMYAIDAGRVISLQAPHECQG